MLSFVFSAMPDEFSSISVISFLLASYSATSPDPDGLFVFCYSSSTSWVYSSVSDGKGGAGTTILVSSREAVGSEGSEGSEGS